MPAALQNITASRGRGAGIAFTLRMMMAAIQSGERVAADEAKQQVMLGGAPWPRRWLI